MKKLIPTLILIIGLISSVQAEYLWWFINNPTVEYNDAGTVTSASSENIWLWENGERLFIENARVKVQGDGVADYLTVGLSGYDTPLESVGTDLPVSIQHAWAVFLPSDYASDSFSFVIELGNYYNANWVPMASSQITYNNASDYISKGLEDRPQSLTVGSFDGTPYGVIPEPTSGLLVLIGAGLLALRRRR